MSGHSPIKSLRRLSPISDADAALVFGDGREELLGGLTRQPVGRARPRRVAPRRRRMVLALAALAVVVIATAATWVVLSKTPAHETTSVECVINGVDTIIPSTSGDPAHDCAVEWKRELGNAAPALIAYDNTFGGVTVLPRTTNPPAGWKALRSQDISLIQLQTSLDDYVSGLYSSCLGAKAATALAKQKLADFGFTGWTVTVGGGGSQPQGVRTCIGAAYVDPATQNVSLGGFGLPSGPPDQPTKLAARLRPIAQRCESLPAAVASVRAAAGGLGLSESPRGYDLNVVTDKSLRCASIYETVGGTIFLTVRGPGH
jgi:hypothetical protein